jgi:hypothetical protein
MGVELGDLLLGELDLLEGRRDLLEGQEAAFSPFGYKPAHLLDLE